ncbi:OadG family protein [Natranaerofaba carboxydovora]|uniref:OadG family protein n=1 Tax=Natranaerofaba carboxydovora TaxID=2742683 RepID=UPI001F1378CE|nr:OadG family protein [Natranaerofaba carboxydovora]UMZ73493.1 Oxaloacetate decarboxylase, gamma chain [Natranaerofaba carboxydovora]
MSEEVLSGLQVTALGFAIVIIALFLLYLIIVGLSRFLNPEATGAGSSQVPTVKANQTNKEATVQKHDTKISKEENKQETKDETYDVTGGEETINNKEDECLDYTTIAAISASISMMLGTSEGGFRIRSIKPIKRNDELSFWTISGRENLMKPHHDIN